MTMLSETRERFLRAIVAAVPPERIAEIYFFQPIKQGGVESGVAVVAAEEAMPTVEPVIESAVESAEAATEPVIEHAMEPEVEVDEAATPRFTVFTARYRLTLKGPDRGKWDASVVAEAEAPLITVDAVVRGVQRRSGDVEEADRMSGDDVRAALHLPGQTPDTQVA